jgi:hypothetical protein
VRTISGRQLRSGGFLCTVNQDDKARQHRLSNLRRGLWLVGLGASLLYCGAASANNVHFIVDGVSGPLAEKLAYGGRARSPCTVNQRQPLTMRQHQAFATYGVL